MLGGGRGRGPAIGGIWSSRCGAAWWVVMMDGGRQLFVEIDDGSGGCKQTDRAADSRRRIGVWAAAGGCWCWCWCERGAGWRDQAGWSLEKRGTGGGGREGLGSLVLWSQNGVIGCRLVCAAALPARPPAASAPVPGCTTALGQPDRLALEGALAVAAVGAGQYPPGPSWPTLWSGCCGGQLESLASNRKPIMATCIK